MFGNGYFGIYLGNGNTDEQVLNNTIFNNGTSGNSYTYGIQIYGARDLASGNQIYGQNIGIDASYSGAAADAIAISNNIVRSNFVTGIQASSTVIVSGNTVYGQSATYGYGIYSHLPQPSSAISFTATTTDIFSDSRIDGNRVFANTYGINLRYARLVQNNKVYSNQIGIFSSGWSYSGSIQNNVVYSNTGTAIDLQGSNGARIVNNTVFQPVGNAVRLESSTSNAQVRATSSTYRTAPRLSVASDSMTGLVNVANVTADPLFVNPAGADGVLGYRASDGYDGGTDDNFYVSKTSPAIDAGDSWNAPQTDALGYGRSDDPATPNTGTNDYYPGATTTSVYTIADSGVAQGWHADDAAFSLALPFAFPFYGTSYTSVQVSTNGFLQFTGAGDATSGANSTTALADSVRIAPLWDDLRTDLDRQRHLRRYRDARPGDGPLGGHQQGGRQRRQLLGHAVLQRHHSASTTGPETGTSRQRSASPAATARTTCSPPTTARRR